MRFRPSGGPTIKVALALGFGATVALWLLAGFQFAARMGSAQAEAAHVNRRYMQAQELLSSVRAQVLLASVYVRDAALDPDTRSTPAYRQRLEEAYRSADESLKRYVPVVDTSSERGRLDALRQSIDEVRQASLEVLTGDGNRTSNEALLLLSRDIGPRRDLAVRVSDEIQSINRTSFVDQQKEVATLYATTQRQVWQRFGLALGASLCIALVATLYVGRLERDVTRRQAKERQTTNELQRLSARLVSVQEEERRSIARELHDEVGQVLMAIKMELTLAQRAIEADGASRHLLDEAQSIADGALNTVRDLSHLLHPSLLDDLGLPAAIDWYVTGFAKRHGLRAELSFKGVEERLATEVESTLFRIVQEALANVAKHAVASRCGVEVRAADGRLTLVVWDDGIGFNPAIHAHFGQGHRGLGLIGIRERASSMGGTTRVESSPGRGTRLIVEMPRRVRPSVTEVDSPDEVRSLDELGKLEMIRG